MDVKVENNVVELIPKNNLVASNLENQLAVARQALEANSKATSVILNLHNVIEIDSLGINLIVGLYKQCQTKGIEFKVTNTARPIVNLFNLFKLTSYFDVS